MISIEEIVREKGNQIIDEVVEIIPKIKQAFHGIEEKLAALIFHNPTAIGEHHNDMKKLREEAEIAHQQQKIYEGKKKEENLAKQQEVKDNKTQGTKEIASSFISSPTVNIEENISSVQQEIKTKILEVNDNEISIQKDEQTKIEPVKEIEDSEKDQTVRKLKNLTSAKRAARIAASSMKNIAKETSSPDPTPSIEKVSRDGRSI